MEPSSRRGIIEGTMMKLRHIQEGWIGRRFDGLTSVGRGRRNGVRVVVVVMTMTETVMDPPLGAAIVKDMGMAVVAAGMRMEGTVVNEVDGMTITPRGIENMAVIETTM